MNSSEIRKLINIVEDKAGLKRAVIAAIQSTTDDNLLQKVLATLQAGNIDERIAAVIGQDADAKPFVRRIANVIVDTVAPLEVKEQFLAKYPSGIINPKMLLDGNEHSFLELCGGDYFATEVFTILCTQLSSQGVGPGEVALAVMSPAISWSGRAVGGGDIQVGNKAVEVKTSVSSGGRWINPRKAKMDMSGIQRAILDGLQYIAKKTGEPPESMPQLPDRLNPDYWVSQIRPILAQEPKVLQDVASLMADGLFNQTNNTIYRDALISGNPVQIKDAIIEVGYNNYKTYSKFDGILMMDVPSESSQYFPDYASMAGKINSGVPYLYGPETEGMPKIRLLPGKSAVSDKAPAQSTTAKKSVQRPKSAEVGGRARR